MPDALILAAFPAELAGLAEAPPRGWRTGLTGVGGVTAAARTASLLQELRPPRVIFLGTCGAYGDLPGLGSCISASEVLGASAPEILGRAYRPSIETSKWSPAWEIPLPGCRVVAPPAITASHEDSVLLARAGDVEHLELGGVFAACFLADVPVAAALSVANRTGPGAHAEWKANNASASRRLVETLIGLGVFGG